jgi:hypothetical protein
MIALHCRLDQTWAAGRGQRVSVMAGMRRKHERRAVAGRIVWGGKMPGDGFTNQRAQSVLVHTASV